MDGKWTIGNWLLNDYIFVIIHFIDGFRTVHLFFLYDAKEFFLGCTSHAYPCLI